MGEDGFELIPSRNDDIPAVPLGALIQDAAGNWSAEMCGKVAVVRQSLGVEFWVITHPVSVSWDESSVCAICSAIS